MEDSSRPPRPDVGKVGRAGAGTALAVISIILAVAVALLISGVRDQLPVIAGLDYWVIQVGLVGLVVVFSLYSFDREMRLAKLSQVLEAERIEATRVASELVYLQEVQKEKDTVAALLYASADGMMVVDPGRVVNRTNPALVQITGLPLEQVEGRTCEEIFGCRRDGRLSCGKVCPFERVLGTGEPLRDHLFQSVKDDEPPKWISGAYAPVRDTAGKITLAIGSLRDVSRSKEVEQLQHDFVSIVSHELRGPLTAIKGFIKTLLTKGHRLPQETHQEFLETINEQADRLNQLVEDLLNVSRIESRRLRLTLTDVDLEAVTRKLVSQFSSKWGHRSILIESDPNVPLIRADHKKIEEVLINLIDNAIKYSPEGGDIKVMFARMEESIEVAIEDSGLGMAPEDTARLFEKFHRIATRQTRDIGGTGLGLYIVKNLVEAHGGGIIVSSAPGVGSTFTVTLPVRGPAEVDA